MIGNGRTWHIGVWKPWQESSWWNEEFSSDILKAPRHVGYSQICEEFWYNHRILISFNNFKRQI